MNIFLLTAIWYISQMIFLGGYAVIADNFDIYALWEVIQYGTIGIFLAIVGQLYIDRCILFTSLFSMILNVAILYHACRTIHTWFDIYMKHTPGRKPGFMTRITYAQALAIIEMVGWSFVIVHIVHNVLFYNLNCLLVSIL